MMKFAVFTEMSRLIPLALAHNLDILRFPCYWAFLIRFTAYIRESYSFGSLQKYLPKIVPSARMTETYGSPIQRYRFLKDMVVMLDFHAVRGKQFHIWMPPS